MHKKHILANLCYELSLIMLLQAVNALTPNDNIKILKGTCTGSSSVDENTPETIINQPKADLHGGNSQRGSNPTLDRINL